MAYKRNMNASKQHITGLCRPRIHWPRVESVTTWSPTALAGAYNFPKITNATEQKIGIIELGGGWNMPDMVAAFGAWKLPLPSITNVSVDGGANAPGSDADGEVVLDIQLAAAAYSYCTGKPANIRVYFAPNSDTGFKNAVAQAAMDGCSTVSISWGCYDRETEVLTKDGWRYFADICGNEQIATLNPDTGMLEYQSILKVHKYPYKGELHHYEGRCTDLLVTPNHSMYVQHAGHKKASLLPSQEIFDCNWFFVPKTANWIGEEVGSVEVCGQKIDTDLWLEFLGYFLSEGWASFGVVHHKERDFTRCKKVLASKRRRLHSGQFAVALAGDARVDVQREYVAKAFDEDIHTVGVSQVKEDNLAKIQKCLDGLPFKFVRKDHSWVCRSSKEFCAELVVFGKSYQKFIPGWVKSLCPRQLKIFYDALMLGDGYRGRGGKQAYYTSSPKMADDVQEILLKLGFVGSITSVDRRGRVNAKGTTRHVEYRVNIKETYKTERLTKRELVDYDGFVYCLTVPNHIMFVRRNGKPAWCGNSPEDSWGIASCKIFDATCAVAVALGSTIFAASGDNDSGDGESGINVDFPSSSPNVIGCGGTTKTRSAETVWNNGNNEGTGGGYSAFFPSQAWQVGTPSKSGRMVPDIAGLADPQTGYPIYLDGSWQVVGGTSCVAPFMAGLWSAINAGLATQGHPLVGFCLPLIWSHTAAFSDVLVGDNGQWRAGVGPDPCTGLGTPIGVSLAKVLGLGSNPVPPSPPVPPAPPVPPSPPPPVVSILTTIKGYDQTGKQLWAGIVGS